MKVNKILICISLLIASSTMIAQEVGINTNSPDQALDINGKVRISDDVKTPTAGTVRYNSSSSDFEGYDGAAWNSFTQSGTVIPDNAVAIYGVTSVDGNGEDKSVLFYSFDGTVSGIFTPISPNKKFVITWVSISLDSASKPMELWINSSTTFNGNPVSSTGKRIVKPANVGTYELVGNSPLWILAQGTVLNVGNATYDLRVEVRGWMIDN